jgi:hypothetical protein
MKQGNASKFVGILFNLMAHVLTGKSSIGDKTYLAKRKTPTREVLI